VLKELIIYFRLKNLGRCVKRLDLDIRGREGSVGNRMATYRLKAAGTCCGTPSLYHILDFNNHNSSSGKLLSNPPQYVRLSQVWDLPT
jgi:hypothetical protein